MGSDQTKEAGKEVVGKVIVRMGIIVKAGGSSGAVEGIEKTDYVEYCFRRWNWGIHPVILESIAYSYSLLFSPCQFLGLIHIPSVRIGN